MRNFYLFFLLASICFSFTNRNERIEAQLHGIWELKEFKEGIFLCEKKKRILKKHQAYHFQNNGKVFIRIGVAMCGSDKVYYSDEFAKWSVSADSILNIEHEYSTMIYKKNFKFLKIIDSQLFLKMLDYEEIKK